MYKLHKLFPVPIFQFKFSKHNNYYFADIERSEKIPKDWKCSINTSYPSINNDDSFIRKYERDYLKNELLEEIKLMFGKSEMPTNISFNDMFWYNVYHESQGQERHNHLGNCNTSIFWSGIYYNKNASPTIFYPTSTLYKTNKFIGYENSILSDCYFDHVKINVSDGDVILFPPYLDHEVILEKNFGDKMRLTFAFNIELCQ